MRICPRVWLSIPAPPALRADRRTRRGSASDGADTVGRACSDNGWGARMWMEEKIGSTWNAGVKGTG